VTTHLDLDLRATERQMGGRKMLATLGGVRAAAVLDSRDVKWGAVRFPSALHGLRLEFLEIQLVAAPNPTYRAGIADENFESTELIIKKIEF